MGRYRYTKPVRPTRAPMVPQGRRPQRPPLLRHWLDQLEAEQEARDERLRAQLTGGDGSSPDGHQTMAGIRAVTK